MSGVKSLILSVAGLLAILSCASFNNPKALTAPVNQAAQADNGQQMQALVSEVRQLRLTVERSNFSTYLAQVTLERLRWQQPRVDRLQEKLEKIRAEIAEHRSRLSRLPEELKYIENDLVKETDPVKRRGLERVLEDTQQLRKRFPENIAQLEEQEAQLLFQLQPEQAKLNELNGRLDAMQKDLEVVDKPQPGGKRQ